MCTGWEAYSVPGIDSSYMQGWSHKYSVGAPGYYIRRYFANFTVFAMGITPPINSSIIMNLLTVAIPRLEQLAKEGEEGRKKIAQYSRYLTVILAFVQAIGITYGLAQNALENRTFIGYIVVALTLTAGTAFLMWLGEQITDKGIGNGISLIIFTSIVSRLPIAVVSLWQLAFVVKTMSPWSLPVILIFAVVMITGVIFVDSGERRIPVQYSKRVVGRKVYGGQSTHIPMKVNSSGVLPIIFAVSILSLPQIIAQFFPGTGFYAWVDKNFDQSGVLYGYYMLCLLYSLPFSIRRFHLTRLRLQTT